MLACVGCVSDGGIAANSAIPSSEITADLLRREAELTDAARSHDDTALDQILAPEFRLTFVRLTDMPGKPEITRERWLENLRSMTFGPVEMQDQIVTMQGENVATVRMNMVLHDWRMLGNLIPPNYDLTDIWVRRDGRWQLVNRISEPLDFSGSRRPASDEPTSGK